MKVQDVKRSDVAGMMKKVAHKPAEGNRTFSVMRKMFNLAEVWGYRLDGTNPCRHVPMFPAGKSTHLINDEKMGKLFRHFDKIEAGGLESYVIPLAIRLQFERGPSFRNCSARMGMGRPRALSRGLARQQDRRHVQTRQRGSLSASLDGPTARRWAPYVLPSPRNPMKHLTVGEYYNGWSRTLKAAGVTHVGTHGIRRRSATDIANSDIPVKVIMALIAHKTVAMFMRYVHTEDASVRAAADLVANRHKTITEAQHEQQERMVTV